mmetsp:Transcript_60342/g.194319  ORF Transcript_60342/g.194319 Transcript_60342/m.194319 type:complete len:304 (-) Transcript_60342:63-974(-)
MQGAAARRRGRLPGPRRPAARPGALAARRQDGGRVGPPGPAAPGVQRALAPAAGGGAEPALRRLPGLLLRREVLDPAPGAGRGAHALRLDPHDLLGRPRVHRGGVPRVLLRGVPVRRAGHEPPDAPLRAPLLLARRHRPGAGAGEAPAPHRALPGAPEGSQVPALRPQLRHHRRAAGGRGPLRRPAGGLPAAGRAAQARAPRRGRRRAAGVRGPHRPQQPAGPGPLQAAALRAGGHAPGRGLLPGRGLRGGGGVGRRGPRCRSRRGGARRRGAEGRRRGGPGLAAPGLLRRRPPQRLRGSGEL